MDQADEIASQLLSEQLCCSHDNQHIDEVENAEHNHRAIAEALRQYAAEAVAAERERCVKIIEQVQWLSPKIAAQIREEK